jgi:hypothetical protein
MPNIWQVRNAIIGNNGSCLAHQPKGHLMSFISGYFLNRSSSQFIDFFEGSLVFEVISKFSRLESSSLALSATYLEVTKWCRNLWVFKSMGKMVFLSYYSTTLIPGSLPRKLKIIPRFLYLIFNINANIL